MVIDGSHKHVEPLKTNQHTLHYLRAVCVLGGGHAKHSLAPCRATIADGSCNLKTVKR